MAQVGLHPALTLSGSYNRRRVSPTVALPTINVLKEAVDKELDVHLEITVR